METARVDIRKLQLLNDRINQCLDALTQVRASVHGLSHTAAPMPGVLPPPAQLGGIGVAADPRFAYGYSPFGAPMAAVAGGLSHTPFAAPAAPFFAAGANPAAQQIPTWAFGAGLSHSPFEAESIYGRSLGFDPILASRVRETFPYAGYALPPVISVF